MKTALLNPDTWDFMIDANGELALADEPYRLAQDAVCNLKLWRGDIWYYTDAGIPYIPAIFGKNPQASLIKSYLEDAVKGVKGVNTATAYIHSLDSVNRVLSATVVVNNKITVTL